MNGQNLVDLITNILDDEAPNQAYILQLINLSKTIYENKRPWKFLVTLDKSMTVIGSNTYLTPFTLPANFRKMMGESSLTQGKLILFDGANNVQYLTEIPYERILDYKDLFGYFAVDYAGGKFYITGVVPGTFTIYMWYIKKTDPITLSTTWVGVDSDYHPILAFDAAAHWRLGTDYDDVNARNADDNYKMAANIYEAMSSWDAERAISAVNNIDYPNINNEAFRGMSGFGPRGVRL